jgi:hypothetical protein
MSRSFQSKNPYEQIYGKQLSPDKLAEMKFNLLGYLKTLIEMDRQYQAWLVEKKQKEVDTNDNK